MEPLFLWVWVHALAGEHGASPHLDTPRISGDQGRCPGRRRLHLCHESGRGSRPSPPRCSSFAALVFASRALFVKAFWIQPWVTQLSNLGENVENPSPHAVPTR